jgi:hypothetical protein
MDEESVSCKSLAFMFLCQFTVICLGTLCMTLVAIAKQEFYIKVILFMLITLLTFKLEKFLFMWSFDSICNIFICDNTKLSYQKHNLDDVPKEQEIDKDKSQIKHRVSVKSESEKPNYII